MFMKTYNMKLLPQYFILYKKWNKKIRIKIK